MKYDFEYIYIYIYTCLLFIESYNSDPLNNTQGCMHTDFLEPNKGCMCLHALGILSHIH